MRRVLSSTHSTKSKEHRLKLPAIEYLRITALKTNEYFFIYPKQFKETLAEFPLLMACTKLHEAGILHKPPRPEKGYEFQYTIAPKITGGSKKRAYKIVPIALEEENE
ncbi:hypothetical protein [Mannheimia haemolytica]|uniref:hypothetical protein n=1 Tax=Mannheimia haemolytica TaxID=75985 RepID=UPI0038F62D0E